MSWPASVLLAVFAASVFALGGTEETLSFSETSKRHSQLLDRYFKLESLMTSGQLMITPDALEDLKSHMTRLAEAKKGRIELMRRRGWSEFEYLNILKEECSTLPDWATCSQKLLKAGYSGSLIDETERTAQKTQWKWVNINEKYDNMVRRIKSDRYYKKTTQSFVEEMNAFEVYLSKAEKEVAAALQEGKGTSKPRASQ